MMSSKRSARFLAVVLALFLASCMPGVALAVPEEGLSRLTVSCKDASFPWQEGEFSLYLLTRAEGDALTLQAPFSSYGVDLDPEDDSHWREAACALEGYVVRDGLTPTRTQPTDEKGNAVFDSLPRGLYLVLGKPLYQENFVYETEPFLVRLPGVDAESGQAVPEQTIYPKWGSRSREGNMPYKVLKVWQDGDTPALRPNEIEVQLFCDGVIFDAVTLTADTAWRYQWDALPTDHHWTVTETVPSGYSVSMIRQGSTLVMTNRAIGAIPPPESSEGEAPPQKLPQTGQLWWPVPVLAALGILLILWGLLRRRGWSHEE